MRGLRSARPEPAHGPLISVLTPVFNPPVDALRSAVASVRAQRYPHWELILVDDGSEAAIRAELLALAEQDSRITVHLRTTNGGIVAASADALERATGAFIALLDHDDELHPDALHHVVAQIVADPQVDYVYTDEDKIGVQGEQYDEFRKPAWSPQRLRGQMYTAHLSVMRTALVREVGGFRPGYEGSQDHDLALRVSERARTVAHVPHVLYHWRVVAGSAAGSADAKPYAWESGRRAVEDHLARIGRPAEVVLGPLPGTYRTNRPAPPNAKVSVIIPTRGGQGLIWGLSRVFVVDAIKSALERTKLDDVEFVVVYDSQTPAEVLADLQKLTSNLVLVEFTEPFNFSRKCNAGFLASSGDILVFLNDDVQADSENWLETLIAPLADPRIGLTGAKLLFEDSTLQHGGHLYDRGEMTHILLGADAASTEAFSALHIDRECSGVTAACAAIRRSVFEEIGGFHEGLPNNFNDVDFCCKIRYAGYDILWLAGCVLFHFESRTRESIVHRWELQRVLERWGEPDVDPYFPRWSQADGSPIPDGDIDTSRYRALGTRY